MDATDHYQPPRSAPQDIGVAETFTHTRLFALDGRLGRLRYMAYGMAAGFVLMIPAVLVGAAVGATTGNPDSPLLQGVIGIAYVLAFAMSIVLGIRRCHDFNATGWLSILGLVPLLNLVLYLVPGTKGQNRFGAPPPPNSTALVIAGLVLPAIVIVGIVAAVALPAYNDYVDRANAARVSAP